MKKLLVVLGISLVLLAMPLTTATHPVMPKLLSRHARTLSDGNFSGVYALKNETGYVPLGTFEGTFGGSNYTASFTGTWVALDGNSSGTMEGMVWGHLYWGSLTVTETNQSTWFGGLYHVNETDNSFASVSIIFGQEDFTILYELGDLS